MSIILPTDPPSGNPEKTKSPLFHRFPLHIWDDQSLSLHERIVLCRVWSFENSTPPLPCYLSFEQWARELGCTRRHAINLLGRLVDRSFLLKESRGLETNIWRLVNTVHYQQSDSEYSSPSLVNTVHYPSEYSSPSIVNTVHPRRSLEDQLEDHKEDQATDAASIVDPRSTKKESTTPKKQKQSRAINWSQIDGTPEQIEALKLWDTYKRAKRSPVLQMTLQGMIKKHGDRLAENIEHSIANGWSGCFEAKKQMTDNRVSKDEAIGIFLDLVRLARNNVSKAVEKAVSDQKIIAAVKKAGIGKGTEWITTIGQVEGAVLQAEQNKFVAAYVTA